MFTTAVCLLESDTLQGWRRRSPAAAGPSLTGVISGGGGGGGQGCHRRLGELYRVLSLFLESCPPEVLAPLLMTPFVA